MVNAQREAIFGDESVAIQKISLGERQRAGVMTGEVLAGFCEVQMPSLDGGKHWYPIDGLEGEQGEKVVEDEVPIDEGEGEADNSGEGPE